jgi:peroxiredoxin
VGRRGTVRTVTVGHTTPPFELTGMDGQLYSLKEALMKGPLLAAFFKVTCPTCQFTLPFVEKLHRQFRGEAVHVWGISQDTVRDSKRFAEHFGVSFPILIDEEPYETSQEYGLVYVPTLFLINPEGQVEVSAQGFSRSDLIRMQKWLVEYFDAQPAELFHRSEKIPEYKPG